MPILPPDPNVAALRVALTRLRTERGWTLEELAHYSGLGRSTLLNLEHGRTVGNVRTWHALAHAFDVPIERLLAPLCDGHTPPGTQDS